jgi:hypothetical protein
VTRERVDVVQRCGVINVNCWVSLLVTETNATISGVAARSWRPADRSQRRPS